MSVCADVFIFKSGYTLHLIYKNVEHNIYREKNLHVTKL